MKQKAIPTIKSIVILALAALAIFQVSRLWLVNITNRNFFLYLQARFPPAAPDGQSAFAQPFRIFTSAGDGLFEVRYSGIFDSDEWAFGEQALRAVLQNGVHESQSLTLSEVFSRPVFVYEYAFEMCVETFSRALGQRNGSFLADAGITEFTRVAVQPIFEDESALHVFFINEDDVWGISLQAGARRNPAENFTAIIEPVNPENLHFTVGAEGFIPQIPIGGFEYNIVSAENPFRDPHGILRRTHIQSLIEPFFDNPVTIFPGGADNIFTFSNRNTMVRYLLETTVLEYTSYRTVGRTAAENFMADFSAALDFVRNDPLVVNEIFLRNHEPRMGANIFWFDYVIDNKPLVLTGEWLTSEHCMEPLLAPIEVIADHGRVVRYRRLGYTFSSDEEATFVKEPPLVDGFFSLGFPISDNAEINLSALLEGR
ncbi:MAG: hypothetical protein FWF81_14065 [Defluviitaleaceae bacterium]|nr:hypothetical protein [Defluviitaleaceae bacterium]